MIPFKSFYVFFRSFNWMGSISVGFMANDWLMYLQFRLLIGIIVSHIYDFLTFWPTVPHLVFLSEAMEGETTQVTNQNQFWQYHKPIMTQEGKKSIGDGMNQTSTASYGKKDRIPGQEHSQSSGMDDWCLLLHLSVWRNCWHPGLGALRWELVILNTFMFTVILLVLGIASVAELWSSVGSTVCVERVMPDLR